MDYRLIGISLTALLSLADFLSEGRFLRSQFKQRLVSFAAGVSVAYIFLHLFPQIYFSLFSSNLSIKNVTFFSMLIGFVSYHLIEKWIYHHAKRDEIVAEIEQQHVLTLFFYHFVIGIVFISLLKNNRVDGLLYFIPISLHVLINALPHSHRFEKKSVRAFFVSAPILGAILASLVTIPEVLDLMLLVMIAGILLFVEAREIAPSKRSESISFFLLGVITFVIVIITMRFYVG